MNGRSTMKSGLILFLLASGSAFSQASTIPGVGGGVPPKVLIIFDTSTSMRHLPTTDIPNTPSFPPAPPRDESYAFDDYTPATNGSPDGGCDSRFCIAKRVLYNTMPTYADSIQMGLSSYFQFRTQWQQPIGTTQCVYDVLAGPGQTTNFASASTYLPFPTTYVPPTNSSRCDATKPANFYSMTQVGTDGGTSITCNAYRPMTGSGPWNINTACNSANNFVASVTSPAPTEELYGTGSSRGTSNIWVRVPRGASCPTGTAFWRASNTYVSGGTLPIGTFGGTNLNVFSYVSSPTPTFSTFSSGWSPSCGAGLAACQLTVQNDMIRGPVSETSLISLWADAGSPLDGGSGLSGPFTFAGYGTTAYYNYYVDAGVTCTWRGLDNAVATNNSSRHVASIPAAYQSTGAPIASCSGVIGGTATLNAGCRLTARDGGVINVAGTWSPTVPTGTVYTWTAPTNFSSTCSGTAGAQSLPYSATTGSNPTYALSVVGGPACANYIDTTNAPCSATNPCHNRSGAISYTTGVTTYKPLADAGILVLKSGYPTTQVIYRARTGYATACSSGDITDGQDSCTLATPCAVTSLGVDAGGTLAPGDQYWYSATNFTYAVDGGTAMAGDPVYSFVANDSMLTVPLTGAGSYGPEKTGSGCTATVTLTDGTSLSGAQGACSASRPCTLTNIADVCKSISTGNVVTCSSGSDSTQKRFCQYQSQRKRYSATPYGSCAYSRKTYVYETPVCRYTRNAWKITPPTCTEPRIQCLFDVREARYSYHNPYNYCRAYATRYNYKGTSPLAYIYQWATKGGEYLGQFAVTSSQTGSRLGLRNYCELGDDRYPEYSAAPNCPAEINSTNHLSFSAGTAKDVCGVGGKICRLRWRTTVDAGAPNIYRTGRMAYAVSPYDTNATYATFNDTDVRCATPDRDGGEIVTPNPTSWVPVAPGNQDNWCFGTGTNGAPQYRLLSDWYQPARANPVPSTALPFADFWTNQPTKASGWSLNVTDGGASQIFVPMNFGTSNIGDVKRALTACVRPTDLNSPMSGGFCMADDDNCGSAQSERCQSLDAGMTDFTPLNGALANAADYMREQLRTDTSDVSCRDYYVVLVTDGLESTPANYTQTDLENTVNNLTNLTSTSPTRTKEVKTFVIGFGAGLTPADGGANGLDVIARRGKTAVVISGGNVVYDFVNGHALSAENEAELSNVLGIVFSSITQGRFARSRPTLTSTGKRIYQAYFDRGVTGSGLDAGTPEWRGNMIAYDIDVTGSLLSKWEYRAKLDAQSGPGRQIKALMPLSDGGTNPIVFNTTNAASMGLTSDVVKFVRNDGLGTDIAGGEAFTPIAIPRMTRAGAFVFSNPVAVGAPVFGDTGYAGLAGEAAVGSYVTFKAAFKERETRVLIGSEDGLFHGIVDNPLSSYNSGCSAADELSLGCPNGREAWAVVPSSIVAKLPATRTGPQLLVDGTAAVADVCWQSGLPNAADCGNGDWRTIAIGSLRAGGQSASGVGIDTSNSEYFALDVTDGGFPTPLWRFDDRGAGAANDNLGLTYSTPTIGRVSLGSGSGEKHWVAFAGGGKCSSSAGFDAGVDNEGGAIYMLDVKTGKSNLGSSFNTKYVTSAGPCSNFVARPTAYRSTGKVDVETVYYGNELGTIWAQRLWQSNSAANWAPGIWYDGWSSAFAPDMLLNAQAPIWYLVKDTAGGFTAGTRVASGCKMHLGSAGTFASLPTRAGASGSCTVLGTRRPIFGRPRIAYANDASLISPDVFFGTGDAQALDNTSSRDFFFAVYDERFADKNYMSDPSQKGKTSWVYMFDPGEKVLGEPVVTGGSIVVATYAPPLGGTCNQLGDSYLYAFDPRTGAPRDSLRDPNYPSSTVFASVVKLTGAGAISDPIVVNGGLYYADGRGDVNKVETRPVGLGGRIQGWRRIR